MNEREGEGKRRGGFFSIGNVYEQCRFRLNKQ